MVIHRGDVWWATLPTPRGSEPGYRRPVLVVQSDSFNSSAIQTVLAIPLTTNLQLAAAPGNVRLPAPATGLSKPSIANVSQVMTIDKRFLLERVSRLPDRWMQSVEGGLRLVLEL